MHENVINIKQTKFVKLRNKKKISVSSKKRSALKYTQLKNNN